ncbi:MAG: alpha/beta hydrolase [Rhizobiales bacterium]|nr:alpha/beta hydrolase [Hyphomicrobiales bacterium]
MNHRIPIIFALFVAVLAGCAKAPDSHERRATAAGLARQGALQAEILNAGEFDLLSYSRPEQKADLAIIYIEGDGLAYISRSKPSRDPTPVDPLTLKLALADPRPGVAYLARPCQFTGGDKARNCYNDLWTISRYSPDVVAASMAAIDQLVARMGARHIALVGYSGGGVIALLVAAQRQDVAWVTTVASPLDVDAFTTYHKVARMSGSLNPVDAADRLATLPQIHYVGADDEIVPPGVVDSYLHALGRPDCAKMVIERNVNHHQGWDARWAQLIKTIPHCEKARND